MYISTLKSLWLKKKKKLQNKFGITLKFSLQHKVYLHAMHSHDATLKVGALRINAKEKKKKKYGWLVHKIGVKSVIYMFCVIHC